jgi:hypothetical protein
MKYDSPEWVEPALEVIRRSDPELLARMQKSDWKVYVPWSVSDLAAEPVSPWLLFGIAAELDSAFGATQENDSPEAPNTTWVNPHLVENKAEELGVTVAEFAADVLAHEFAHIEGADEAAAFAEGTRFGQLEHEPAIAALSDQTATALVGADGEYTG